MTSWATRKRSLRLNRTLGSVMCTEAYACACALNRSSGYRRWVRSVAGMSLSGFISPG